MLAWTLGDVHGYSIFWASLGSLTLVMAKLFSKVLGAGIMT